MAATFVEERRKAALEAYEREELPTWRRSGFWTTTVRKLRLDELEPRHYEPLDELPEIVREHLGEEEHAALLVQRGASIIHLHVADPSVTVMPLEQAVEQHPELVEPWFMKRLSHEEGKFQAAAAAFWSGGAFVHVPKEVRVEKPIQIVWLIDEPGTAQYAHTLALIGEHAECSLREYCLAPEIEGQALHSGGFELYARPGAQVDLAHYQDAWRALPVADLVRVRSASRRFAARSLPDDDLVAFVLREVAQTGWKVHARVTVLAPAETVIARINPAVGIVEAVDSHTSVLVTGADALETIAIYLSMLMMDFRVDGPPELVAHIRTLARRYTEALDG